MAENQPDPTELLARIERLESLVAQLQAPKPAPTRPAPPSSSASAKPKEAAAHTSSPSAATQLHSSAALPATATASDIFPEYAYRPAATLKLPQVTPPRRTSLETDFGSRVLSKVAVLLLLIGAAWFLKWAFDNRWIGPTGRIVAGLLSGIAIMLWSVRFRRQGLNAFSYALKAVGSGVLYLSLWAAFQIFHLIPAPVALIAMLLVTAANAALALTQDSELLAAYALLGGYITPLLISTGGNHEVFLFTYIFSFAAATLALLKRKPWSGLLLGVFPITVAYFILWYAQHFTSDQAGLTLFFAILLWTPFAAVPLLARQTDDIISEVLTPLAAAIFGALTVYSVLADSAGRAWEPWAAVAFAAVYLAFTRIRAQRIAAASHLSLAIVFLTVAIPLKATGRAISIAWLAESIALLWLATRHHASTTTSTTRAATAFRWLACAALTLGTFGALLSPYIHDVTDAHAFVNRNFALALGAVLTLAAAIYFAARIPKDVRPDGPTIAAVSLIALNIVLLLAIYRELNLYFLATVSSNAYTSALEQLDFAFSGWMMLQGAALLVIGFLRRLALARWLGLVLLAATVIKAFAYDMRSLGTGYRIISYLVLGVLLMAVSFAYQKDWLGLQSTIEVAEDEVAQ